MTSTRIPHHVISIILSLCTCLQITDMGAQCDVGILPSGVCSTAPNTCFAGRCYNTINNPPTGEPFNWCGANTQVHNPQYFEFIASSPLLVFHINVPSCSGGGCGLQSAIIDTCAWTVENVLVCDPGTPPGGTMVLEYSQATPGKKYWLLIDGCGGQICEYAFVITSGVQAPPLLQIDTVICADSLEIDGVQHAPGTYEFIFDVGEQCDSVVVWNITRQVDVELGAVEICFPIIDSVFVSPVVSGTEGGYTFLWHDGDTVAERWFYNLSPGDPLSVTVTDQAGCSKVASANVSTNVGIELTPEVGYVCPAAVFSTEDLEIFVQGGTPPYTFEWSPPLPAIIFPPASFALKVTDNSGCEAHTTFDVIEVLQPMPVVEPSEPICVDILRTGVTFSVLNPQDYSYFSWTTGEQGPEVSSVVISDPGDYTVFVLDIHGCSGATNFQVQALKSPVVDITDYDPICAAELALGVEIEITIDPGVDSIQYFGDWSGPPSIVFDAGTYGVAVTDTNGCMNLDSTIIEKSELPEAAFYPLVNGTTVVFVNTSTFGTTYFWDFGDGTVDSIEIPLHSYDSVKTYTVQLIVMNACGSDTVVHEVATSSVESPSNNMCNGATELGVLPFSTNDCASIPVQMLCVTGTTLHADPDPALMNCPAGVGPVVWYRFETDEMAAILNIHVNSVAFREPFIQLYYGGDAFCDSIGLPVPLTKSRLSCIRGGSGKLSAQGTAVLPLSTYYLVVGSVDTAGGLFDLCLGTLEMSASPCVTDASLRVTSRSMGGPLEGPFFPGEEVGICLDVNNFQVATGMHNCQWFQGIVPTFGNGWDPGSFDSEYQPKGATLNGEQMPAPNVHNSGTWDWWTTVTYHHDHCFYNVDYIGISDRLGICHALYDADCAGAGIQGGCCGPCWQSTDPGDPGSGTILPPGWFTSGVDGACGGLTGWPTVDWGDGNTCNGPTGPWQFCFKLRVYELIDTITNPELSVGFITFADGEVGSWTGGSSTCKDDMPVKQFFSFCDEPGPKPDAAYEFVVDDDGTVHFTNTSVGGIAYHWDFGDGSTSDLHDPDHTYAQDGTYPVTLIAYGDCSRDTTATEVVVLITAIREISRDLRLNIYPNPNAGSFFIEVGGYNGPMDVLVRDMYGKQVSTHSLVSHVSGPKEMSLSGLPRGLYLVTVRNGTWQHTAKVVLQ